MEGKTGISLMSMAVIMLLILSALSALSSAQDEESYIFNDWVTEGETFEVSGLSVLVMAGEETTSAILMFPQKTLVLEKGACGKVDRLEVCMEDWQYVIGGTVKVHGDDKMKYLINVKVPGPEIEIQRDADDPEIEVGQGTKVIVKILNNGDEPALGLHYYEVIPPQFEITNTNKITGFNNKLDWRGSIPSKGSVEMEYSLRAKSSFSGRIDGVLDYDLNGRKLTKVDSLGLKATSPMAVSIKTDKHSISLGDEDRVYVTVENKRQEDMTADIKVRFPASFSIVASHFNTSEGKLYSGTSVIPAGQEATFITRFRPDSPGDFYVNVSVDGTFSDKGFHEDRTANVSVEIEKAVLYLIHGDIYTGEEAKIKLYMKNLNANTQFTDLNPEMHSRYFNKTGSAAFFNPGEYNELFTVPVNITEKGTFKVNALVTYKAAGRTYTATIEANLEVKDRPKKEEPVAPAQNATQPAAPEGTAAANASEEAGAGSQAGLFIIVPDTSMIESLYSYDIMMNSILGIMDDFQGVFKARQIA